MVIIIKSLSILCKFLKQNNKKLIKKVEFLWLLQVEYRSIKFPEQNNRNFFPTFDKIYAETKYSCPIPSD